MSDCIFCKIIKREMPSYTVYEDEHALAFLDIQPCTKGHTVVIPKKHVENIIEIDSGGIQNLFGSVKKATEKISDVIKPDGFNIGINHGRAGGNSLDHLHVHILPRWHGDGGGSMHSIINKVSDSSVEELAALFK